MARTRFELRQPGAVSVAAFESAAVTFPQRMLDHNCLSAMGPIRRHRPVLRTGPSSMLVTGRRDVVRVLEDGDCFATPYGKHLLGPFVLGLSGAQHERQSRILQGVIADARSHYSFLDRTLADAQECVSRVDEGGVMDVGRDLVHPVLDQAVREFGGLASGSDTPSAATRLSWARDVFADIFLNPAGFPSVRRQAEHAAREFVAYVNSMAADAAPFTLLSGLQAQHDPGGGTAAQRVATDSNLIGLAIGWLWHTSKAALIAVDELLAQPRWLVDARRAASGLAEGDDPAALRRILWEVLRFRPVQVGLVRTCTRHALLGAGTAHAKMIRPGASVLAGTHSAMWDENVIPDPDRFDPMRAPDQYMIFGRGAHQCLGESVIGELLPAMLAPLLRLDDLRRAPGRAGRLRWVGPSPDGLRVLFTAR